MNIVKRSAIRWDFFWYLGFVFLAYVFGYFGYAATPGNQPLTYPMGWWAWADQGEYLKAANAFRHWNFAPGEHNYPPLYSLLASIFIGWSSGHSFFLLNLFCLLWFSYCFARFAMLFISRYLAFVIFVFTIVLDRTIFSHFIVPWTSTLSTALIGTGLLGFVWLKESPRLGAFPVPPWTFILVGLSLGLVVAARPADGIPAALLGGGLFVSFVYMRRPRWTSAVLCGALSLGAGLIGPYMLFAFNYKVYGSPFGGYLQYNATSNGYHPSDLLEKFVSIWFDGFTLYSEANSALIQNHPWLLLGVAALMWSIFFGGTALRCAAITTASLFTIYLPYGDLLPNGVWRYGNLHYFKWTYPLLALMSVVALKSSWTEWKYARKYIAAFVFLLCVPVILLSVRIELYVQSFEAGINPQEPRLFITPKGAAVDVIDIDHLTGGFNEVYFGQHRVWTDGVEIRKHADFRFVPIPGGTRLLFIRPVHAGMITVVPDPRLRFEQEAKIKFYSYEFGLGAPWHFAWRNQ